MTQKLWVDLNTKKGLTVFKMFILKQASLQRQVRTWDQIFRMPGVQKGKTILVLLGALDVYLWKTKANYVASSGGSLGVLGLLRTLDTSLLFPREILICRFPEAE